MGKKEPKTNAVRIVEAKGISYQLQTYDASNGFLDGVSVALQTGTNPDKVYKTLVLVGHSKEHYVCVIPVALELNLKQAAKHFGEKKLEMVPVKEITQLTGYVKGGCSPVGMKKQFKTAIDISAKDKDTIYVSGGKIGLQMELSPMELANLIGAEFDQLTLI
ncbi:Cys-tRNA(Pro)/Cys-tRNA(Cys) deacylase [Clostridiales Family XIII bacterium PM5-7]